MNPLFCYQNMSLLSLIIVTIGCNKNNSSLQSLHLLEAEKKIQTFNSTFAPQHFEMEHSYYEALLWNYEDLLNIEDKIHYLEKIYQLFNIKIDKMYLDKKNNNKEIWRLSATFYPTGTNFFSSFSEINNAIQDNVYKHYFSEIKEFEEKYKVKITHLLNDTNNRFELSADWLDNTLRFSDLNLLKNTVINGYHLIKEDKLTALFRLLRGKSIKSLKSVSPLKASNAFILDGFDDLATALESSQLSRRLVYSIQSLVFYPTFIFFVGSGVEGAISQHEELKNELKNLLIESYKQELQIKETITDLFKNNKTVSQELLELNIENSKFKLNLLREISKNIKTNNMQDLYAFLRKEFLKLENKQRNLNIKLNNVPENVKDAVLKFADSSALFNPNETQTVELIEKVMAYKKNQEDVLKTFYETKLAGALTESGLSAMYKGMLAYESRAILNLLESFNTNQPSFGFGDFQFTKILGSLGDAFLALGQAQMVAGGIVNVINDINEIHSVSEWIQLINKSPVFNDSTKPEMLIAKLALNDFYRKLRIMTGVKTVGDIGLTAGQFTMLLGGPYGIGNTPATLAGAGATIFGVATKQVAEKIIEANYEFHDADEGSLEQKIIAGDYDINNIDPLKRIENRIEMLVELTQKRAEIKVWQKLYAEIEKSPRKDLEAIILQTKKSFLSGAHYHKFYYNSLIKVFPSLENISAEQKEIRIRNLQFLQKAQEILQNRYSSNENSLNSELLFHRFVIQHLSFLKQNSEKVNEKVLKIDEIDIKNSLSQLTTAELAKEIKNIFNYAEIIGFSEELDRKLLSRIIKGEGGFFSERMIDKFHDYLTIEHIDALHNKPKSSFFVGVNSVLSLYKQYYFPNLTEVLHPIKHRLPKFTTSEKVYEEKIYFFNREKFLNDLENFTTIEDMDKKTVLAELLKTIFVQTHDESRLKAKFFNDHRTPIKKIFDSYYKSIVRNEVLRPTLKTTMEQLELYKFTENLLENTTRSDTKKYYIKLTANKILNGINSVNIGMNLLYTPMRIKEIIQLSDNNEHLKATRNSVEIIIDTGDLFVDVIRGKSLLLAHPKVYANLAGTQVVFNLLSAGFSIWQGVEQLNLAAQVSGQEARDLKISGGIALASAGVSFLTVAAMPFTSFAGPVGAVAGFSLMLGNQIYSTVRFTQSLRELGLNENAIAYYGTMRFFAPHVDISDNPDIVHQTYVKNTQQSFMDNLKYYNKDSNNNIFISKVVYPKLNFYLPYEVATYGYSQSSSRFPSPPRKVKGGQLKKEDIFLCQVNSIYNYSDIPARYKKNLHLFNKTFNRANKRKQAHYTKTINYFPFYMESYSDETVLCPQEALLSTHKMQKHEIAVPNHVDSNKLTQLIYVGMDQQTKDGLSFSIIKGDEHLKNLFIVNKGQLFFNLEGANKDDIFEIRSLPEKESYIDGKMGRDTFSLQYLEEAQYENTEKYLLTSRSLEELEREQLQLKSNNYVSDTENLIKHFAVGNENKPIYLNSIEHFIGSKYNDLYLGSIYDDFAFGAKGNDILFGGKGNDILIGGEGKNKLYGGPGSDTYLIYKNDFANNNSTYNEIYLYDFNTNSSYYSTLEENEKDIILFDIDDIGLIRKKDDLLIVSRAAQILQKENKDGYLIIANLKDFYKIIKLNNNNYPVLSVKDGYFYSYDPFILNENVTWLDSVIVNDQFNVNLEGTQLARNMVSQKGIRLDAPKLHQMKMALGTIGADTIIGNDHDNILNGHNGNDSIHGKKGNDILIATLNLKDNNPTLQLNGGEGEDLYIIQINHIHEPMAQSADINILEEEWTKNTNNSIISLNIPETFENSGIENFSFSNFGHLIFKNKQGKRIFTVNLKDKILPEKVQINFSNKVFNLNKNELSYYFEYVTEAAAAMYRMGRLQNNSYHEITEKFIHIFVGKSN